MSIFDRIANVFSRSKLEREIDAEIRSHAEMRTADNVAAAMLPNGDRRDALIPFGNRTVMRERVGRDLRDAAIAPLSGIYDHRRGNTLRGKTGTTIRISARPSDRRASPSAPGHNKPATLRERAKWPRPRMFRNRSR